MTPISLFSLNTGKWRMCRAVKISLHSSSEDSGVQYATGVVITSLAFGEHAHHGVVFHYQQRTDAVFVH
jgi:hypothetical protein